MDLMQRRRQLMGMIGGKAKLTDAGTYTPSVDTGVSTVWIPHSLGVAPDFIIVMADEFEALEEYTIGYVSIGVFTKFNTITSATTQKGAFYGTTNWQGRTTMLNQNEFVATDKFCNANTFRVPFYNAGAMLKAGVTYHWVVGTYE